MSQFSCFILGSVVIVHLTVFLAKFIIERGGGRPLWASRPYPIIWFIAEFSEPDVGIRLSNRRGLSSLCHSRVRLVLIKNKPWGIRYENKLF
jgi:hypothetical protein